MLQCRKRHGHCHLGPTQLIASLASHTPGERVQHVAQTRGGREAQRTALNWTAQAITAKTALVVLMVDVVMAWGVHQERHHWVLLRRLHWEFRDLLGGRDRRLIIEAVSAGVTDWWVVGVRSGDSSEKHNRKGERERLLKKIYYIRVCWIKRKGGSIIAQD